MRKQKRVTLFNQEQYDGDWPPCNATEFVAWFAEKLGEIPAEYRKAAIIDIGSSACYDCSTANIEIYYDRHETDDEMTGRETEELRRKEAQKAHELQTLAALKAKYE